MGKRRWQSVYFRSLVLSLPVLLALLALPGPSRSEEGGARGRDVYEKYCIGCHGEKGDGRGEAAADLIIKPRDFTLGLFKFKSTPPGSLPTDEDLKRVITNGLPTSAMPRFRLVSDDEKEDLIAYIKSLSGRWKKGTPERRFTEVVVPDFVGTPESVRKGERLFAERCRRCHGTKDSGPPATFFLRWGGEDCTDLVRPANFNYGVIKRGPRVEDIYLSISAGVDGTPMLSYADLLSEEQRWHLTSYILEIMGKVRR